MKSRELYEKAIEKFGKDNQLTVAVEEFSELTKEICKHKRGADNLDNIIEEMADCYIMLSQLQIIFGIDYEDLMNAIDQKEKRLGKNLNPICQSLNKCKCGGSPKATEVYLGGAIITAKVQCKCGRVAFSAKSVTDAIERWNNGKVEIYEDLESPKDGRNENG
jgi:NTP pyrophosphatase (non-canonical NTP hydrolase)